MMPEDLPPDAAQTQEPRMNRWLSALLAAGLIGALPTAGSAQSASAQPDGPRLAQNQNAKPRGRVPQPDLDEEDLLSPRQLDQRPTTRPARRQADQPSSPPERAAPAPRPAVAESTRAIACSGVFAKDSSHMKLATRFDSHNVVFTEVDGPEGSKPMASVLFPKDPRQRLEVWWQNEDSRSDTHLIVINGQSAWIAPKGVRLGLALPALEKLNGKPFKMSGFDQPNGGAVSDWQGGVLDAMMPGGCRLGIRLAPDGKATEAARSEAAGKEFASSDAKMRAVRPIVAEILIGY